MNFPKKITKNGHIICFSTVTFFVLKIEKTFFLAQIETWCFRRFWAIYHCSTTSSYRDMRITPTPNVAITFRGVAGREMGATLPKTNFKQVLNHLSGFENYTFFYFQKKFFSFYPNEYDFQQKLMLCSLSELFGNAVFLSIWNAVNRMF